MSRAEAPGNPNLLQIIRSEDRRVDAAINVGGLAFRGNSIHPLERMESLLVATQVLVKAELENRGLEVDPFGAIEVKMPSENNLAAFRNALAVDGPVVVVMRHGTQLSDIPSKLEMMRLPQNMVQPLTDESVIQGTAVAVSSAVIAAQLGKPVYIVSSENARAQQTAALIAGVAGGPMESDSRLTCIDYLPSDEMSDDELLDLMGRENNGALVWDRDIVDRVAATGPGTYDKITGDMGELIIEGLHRDDNRITILVTHTQQTNAADLHVGLKPSRLDEFGMLIVSQHNPTVPLRNSIFEK